MSESGRRLRGYLIPPTQEEIADLATRDGIELEAGEAADIEPVIAALVSAASEAEEMSYWRPEIFQSVRDPGYRPSEEEDPLNLFIRKIRVEGADNGPLASKTIGVKDNISVAAVPTTNGSRLAAYTPTMDAVVVERILRAGGTIVGKLNMDDFGASGTGETSAFGPPRNPIDPAFSAGGSSGASAAAVRSGAVDLALGVDQGGSGRIPAASCGVVGVKATHGLVPSFGVTYIDHTIDFVTPIAKRVADAALLLEVVAGSDWRDPQWVRGEPTSASYRDAAKEGVDKLRIGVVQESAGDFCEPAVLSGLQAATDALKRSGANVESVSIPIWSDALRIFQPYIASLFSNMFRSEGEGYGHLGYIDVDRAHAFAISRRTESRQLPPQAKAWLVAARHIQDRYMNVPFGHLHNLRLHLRELLSRKLDEFDLLLTPTLPATAPRLLDGHVTTQELLNRTSLLCFNTAPLNLTGHPAISIPSGVNGDGLPTAVQIVGKHFDEYTTFRAAFALEGELDYLVSDGQD